ncbi:hypothetical protein D3C72_1040450 [compost metagenome]
MHLHDTADTFFLALDRVVDSVALAQNARVHAHEGQLADVGVGHELECQRRELLAVVGLAGHVLFVVVRAVHRRNVQRRRHQFDHGVEHALHALVLERAAAQHRLDFAGDRARAQTVGDFLERQVTFFKVLVHQLFRSFGRAFDHLLAPFLGQLDQLGGDFARFELHALRGFVPEDRLHQTQVDHALELVFGTDRNHDRHGVGLQAVDHHLANAEEVGADAVHLVDERQTRHLVLVGLAPDGFRLGLHAADRVVHHDGAVQHAHRALDFNGEVHVAGGVDDVDAVLGQRVVHALPEAGHGSRGDRDATLLFLLHPVGRCRAIVHFAELVGHARVEQDTFGGGGLAGVDVRGDTDVAVALDGGLAGHDVLSGLNALSAGRRARAISPGTQPPTLKRRVFFRSGSG